MDTASMFEWQRSGFDAWSDELDGAFVVDGAGMSDGARVSVGPVSAELGGAWRSGGGCGAEPPQPAVKIPMATAQPTTAPARPILGRSAGAFLLTCSSLPRLP
jgi:hypothetical protein